MDRKFGGPVQSHHVHHRVHGSGRWGRFNARLAVAITNFVGSMTCAYLFAVIALVGLPGAVQLAVTTASPLPLVSWFAQTFLQLVLLSIIIVGQRIQSVASDAMTRSSHEILVTVHKINIEQTKLLRSQERVLARLRNPTVPLR